MSSAKGKRSFKVFWRSHIAGSGTKEEVTFVLALCKPRGTRDYQEIISDRESLAPL